MPLLGPNPGVKSIILSYPQLVGSKGTLKRIVYGATLSIEIFGISKNSGSFYPH